MASNNVISMDSFVEESKEFRAMICSDKWSFAEKDIALRELLRHCIDILDDNDNQEDIENVEYILDNVRIEMAQKLPAEIISPILKDKEYRNLLATNSSRQKKK